MANIRYGRFFRIIFIIFILVVVSVAAKSIYIKHIQIRELSNESSRLDHQIMEMNSKISKIKRNIKIAETDPYSAEHRAEDDFMMVKKNESIMIFKDK